MPQPTQSDLHVNALLTNFSLMYLQEQTAFVAERVFPTISVTKQSDVYARYSRADFNRSSFQLRAASTESAGNGWKVDTSQSYFANVWALHKDIDDQVRGNADAIFNLEAESTRYLVNQALISRELDWVTNFFGSVWTNDWSGVASNATAGSTVLYWSDPSSTPIQDTRLLKQYIQLSSGGYRANKAIMGRQVFDKLCDHPDFVDRIKYGQTPGRPAQVTLDAMAALFELDEVLVMDSIQNTGPEEPLSLGINAGESNAFIGGKSFLLVYTPSAPGIMTPGCGYTFAWTGYFGATPNGNRMLSFYIPQIKSTRVEMEMAYAHKQVSADLGGFISNVIL